ncbi:MAG: AIR synthase-related protein, partial [Halobacteriota archaeon]|nr:AIR synthase-related protein [Halobacteriota archaeon]
EEESRGAVQLGDPITKEPLIHACLEVNDKGLLNGMKDLGGGGLSCVIGEMALAGGYGAEVTLDKVPLKEDGLAPWEIWVSESQERFMLAVSEENLGEVLYIFNRWDVEATVVGDVIPEKILRIWYHNEKIFEMDIEFLTEGPVCCRSSLPEPLRIKRSYDADFSEPEDYNKILKSILSSPNIASKEWIIRQYDHEVRGATVLKPLQGTIAHPTHGDACVIKPLTDSFKGLALTSDVNPSFLKIDPFRGGASAIDEICRNLTSVGAIPHSLADCLNFGNPEKEDRFYDFTQACKGLGYVARYLGVPFVSGNVSFYNETASGSIPPTPTLLGVGIVPDIRRSVTSDVKGEGNDLYLIGETRMEIGGSAYEKSRGLITNTVPDVDPAELKRNMDILLSLIWDGKILACHDVSDGGIGIALSEMLIGGDCGADVDLCRIKGLRSDIKLFSESNTRWIVE